MNKARPVLRLARSRALAAALLGVSLLAALLAAPGGVSAQEAPIAAQPTQPFEQPADAEWPPEFGPRVEIRDWYGWQTIVADVASIGVIAGSLAIRAERSTVGDGSDGRTTAMLVLGFAGFVLASPILHLVHDNPWALGSVLLRAAATGLVIGGTYWFGYCFSDEDVDLGHPPCSETPGALMVLSGLTLTAGMPILDALLALDKPRREFVAFTPWLSPSADAGGAALVGRL